MNDLNLEDDLDDDHLAHDDALVAYRSWTRFIAFVAMLVVAGIIAVMAMMFAGGGNAKACESALRAAGAAAMAGDPTVATKPRSCDGLSDAQLERIGTKVVGDVVSNLG